MDEILHSVLLFPLRAVLFPAGVLPLKVFEPRYLDLVSYCLKEDKPFGVCRIAEGNEVNDVPVIEQVGTLASIQQWDRRDDGLLEIIAVGQQRFKVMEVRDKPNKAMEADVLLIKPEESLPLPKRYQILSNLLKQIESNMQATFPGYELEADDAVSVSNRLAEILPVDGSIKQALLELDHPLDRLDHVVQLLGALESSFDA